MTELERVEPQQLPAVAGGGATLLLPNLVADAGEDATRRFLEFFVAHIRNANTRAAYARAVGPFLAWCEDRGLTLEGIHPLAVGAYIEQLGTSRSRPTVKLHLAAIRSLFDWLVIGQVVPFNPAHAVRGPKHSAAEGKTPVLDLDSARHLLASIDGTDVISLRDRALLSGMTYTFGRISALLGMRVRDYYAQGKRCALRLHEKGGKRLAVPAHHKLEEALDAYLEAAGIAGDKDGPLFRSVRRGTKELWSRPLHRNEAFRMIRRRARAAGLPETLGCHTFRATGITEYLRAGGMLEHAQRIAGHADPRTTKLYDRTSQQITLDEIERIPI